MRQSPFNNLLQLTRKMSNNTRKYSKKNCASDTKNKYFVDSDISGRCIDWQVYYGSIIMSGVSPEYDLHPTGRVRSADVTNY